MDRVLHYIDRVNWGNCEGYRVRVPISGRNIHRTFSTRKLGISLEEAKGRAIAERDALMQHYGVKWPFPTKPKPVFKEKIYGVYRVRRKIRGRWFWYWLATWPEGNRMATRHFSEGAYPPGVARGKAIEARLAAEAQFPNLRQSRVRAPSVSPSLQNNGS